MAEIPEDLIVPRPEGLYCPAGDFHIDPWRPVARAVITHAHADHARAGHAHYLAAHDGRHVLRARLGDITLQTLAYAEPLRIGEAIVSLHPAGHVLGSAQVRVAVGGRVWVVSGDYKVEPDVTCAPFEPVRCEVFITESTFGLPVYRWRPPRAVFDDIDAWWAANAAAGRASVLFGYAFGKAQRLLAGVDPGIGPIVCHGALEALNAAYAATGVALPASRRIDALAPPALRQALVLAPPSAAGSPWLRRCGEYADGFASGWMQLRGNRRRRGLDRGFVLSDHADWPGLIDAIRATGARRIIVTHGQVAVMVRWLRENGWAAGSFATEFGDEANEATVATEETSADGAAAAVRAPVDAALMGAGPVLPQQAG